MATSMSGVPDGRPLEPGDQPAAAPGPVTPLGALRRVDLSVAGGKAANLGELIRAGLPVPPGFCVTTTAYALVAEGAGLGPLLTQIAGILASETDRLAALAAEIRQRVLSAPIPERVAQEVREALDTLGGPEGAAPVAVRSSATAEDLSFASFAGQQDTYLNVIGAAAVLDAVRRCWASLWTDRAVAYRATNGVDQRTVRLAVVVQRMVDSAVAGVLFTADPLTGRRRRAVVDASPGLGEAVVSGAVDPDRFVVDAVTAEILERRPGNKRLAVISVPEGGTRRVETGVPATALCLTDGQLRALAKMGRRVEESFGAPQDVEFAIDATGSLWIVQSRPITTLFPLPESAPSDDQNLRVYFNLNVAQGMFRPFTPMGVQTFRLIGSALAGIAGAMPDDPLAGPAFLVEAGGRLFGDVTGLVRSTGGRRLFAAALERIESRSEPLLRSLFADPRLSARPTQWRRVLSSVARILVSTRLPLRVLVALLAPAAARSSLYRVRDDLYDRGAIPPGMSAARALDLAWRLLLAYPPRIFPYAIGSVAAGLGSFSIAERLLGDLAAAEERDTIKRGLPHNPTTEMDLALWKLAGQARSDPAARAALRGGPADLAESYRAGTLPPVLQRGLESFLARYGHRTINEIDLGMPRWAGDPGPLLATLAGYVEMPPAVAPDAQFQEGALRAEVMVRELARRASGRGRLRGMAVGFLLRRGRQLAGLREMPKFLIVLLMSRARRLIYYAGEEMARSGLLERAGDIFFLTIPEALAALRQDASGVRDLVRERKARYDDEIRRKHLPRLLLSDGTEPSIAEPAVDGTGEVLRGTPASAGEVTGRARVLFDPAGARLEPGDILVTPSTDPGWTPMFLTAGGLVMEMGGAISHGAVVAREYGIPAVVGVVGATERIRDGQEVVVNGTAGTVILKPHNMPSTA